MKLSSRVRSESSTCSTIGIDNSSRIVPRKVKLWFQWAPCAPWMASESNEAHRWISLTKMLPRFLPRLRPATSVSSTSASCSARFTAWQLNPLADCTSPPSTVVCFCPMSSTSVIVGARRSERKRSTGSSSASLGGDCIAERHAAFESHSKRSVIEPCFERRRVRSSRLSEYSSPARSRSPTSPRGSVACPRKSLNEAKS
mmetsp:Transcript_36518/g.88928  ORF Transcript_36518/g.88928 Transcript_36518/m.88928 type:complete len:200 (-) Transcript_36518:401-1000(-)